jgi:Domain of unknown function (DUF4126)
MLLTALWCGRKTCRLRQLNNRPMAMALDGLDTAGLLALAAALGWASGLRLYLVVFITGLAGYMGWLPLPTGLHALQHPMMLGASGLMLFIEFFADKIPGVDSLWDLVHSVVRVPAGAALAAGVFGADSATMGMAAGLAGWQFGGHITGHQNRDARGDQHFP